MSDGVANPLRNASRYPKAMQYLLRSASSCSSRRLRGGSIR